MPNPAVRPGYASIMPRLVAEHGQAKAEWMMHRLRNLNIYPSLFFMDQISSQLRIIRPLAWNKTLVQSQCLGVRANPPPIAKTAFANSRTSSMFPAWARRTT